MKDRHDILDKMLAERLGQLREEPSEELFDRIEQTMLRVDAAAGQQSEPSRRAAVVPLWRRPWAQVVAAVAVAASLFVGVVLVAERGAEDYVPTVEAVVAEHLIMEQGSVEEATAEVALAVVEEPAREAEVEHAPMTNRGSVAEAVGSVDARQRVAVVVDEPQVAGGADDQPQPATAEAVVAEPDNDVAYDQQPAKESDKVRKSRKSRRDSAEVEEFWRNAMAAEGGAESYADDRSTTRQREVRLYAANVGFNDGNMQVQNVARNPMLVAENSSMVGASSLVIDNQISKVSASANQSSLQHYMPVTVGAKVSFPLSDWFAIEAGVNYTNLFSRSKNWGVVSEYGRSQNLHYVGIPLSAVVSINVVGPLALYGRVGTTVERCVSASERIYLDGVLQHTKELKARGLCFVMEAAVGATVGIYEGWGLYAEGALNYWSATTKQFGSYRTENPLGMGLQVGVRYSF